MATKILVFELEDGNTVAVEVSAPTGEQRVSTGSGEVVEKTGEKFTKALEGVEQATKEILVGFAEHLKPQELELTFGLKFSAKAGIVLASTDAEATLSLKATWKSTG